MRNLARSSALEVCEVVGGELVTTLVESVDGQLMWSYRSKTGSGSGPVLGNAAEGYERALEAAKLAFAAQPAVHRGPLIAVWDYTSKRGQVLELCSGRGINGHVVVDFPTRAEAEKYVNDWRASR